MIIEIPDENSIIKWKYNDKDEWKSAEISELIKAYELFGNTEQVKGDLISRSALKEVYSDWHNWRTVVGYGKMVELGKLLDSIDNAPTVVATEDCISREGAINALSKGEGCGNVCRKSLETIPSVQFDNAPTVEPEIPQGENDCEDQS